MKVLTISANSSGSGKTTITLGLMKALMNRGFNVQGYKVGPDYIDSAFHTSITGNPSRNLDIFLMGEEGVKATFSRGTGDYGVVEGVMGLYDGKGIDTSYSTAHVARLLNLPVVLVLSPKAQSATLAAEIKGLMDYENVNIVGVILNNVTESYYKLLKKIIEVNCKLKVFGYVPKDENLKIESRHLGLVQSCEYENIKDKIDYCSTLIEKYVDMDLLMEKFVEVEKYEDNFHVKSKNIRIGIALDKAFSFYYRENIEILSELGEIVYFSPLKDKKLPENLDFLYIGGGYPEVFIEELSGNISMLESIKNSLDNGLKAYAECGGLMYLCESIEVNGKSYETVGFFEGKAYMTSRLQNFGYAKFELISDSPIFLKGVNVNCHEFHKSKVEINLENVYEVKKDMYDGSLKEWKCGYSKKNVLGAYAHVSFFKVKDYLTL